MTATKSRLVDYFNHTFTESDGDHLAHINGVVSIIRIHRGNLHGFTVDNPAFQAEDGHIEYLCDGVLHREDGPAVIADEGRVLENWHHGQRVQ